MNTVELKAMGKKVQKIWIALQYWVQRPENMRNSVQIGRIIEGERYLSGVN